MQARRRAVAVAAVSAVTLGLALAWPATAQNDQDGGFCSILTEVEVSGERRHPRSPMDEEVHG
jgi:hypothetical protein